MRRRRKDLGQHFLVRIEPVASWFRKRLCGLKRVLEIGAGTGALTRRVADCVAELVALEIDSRLLDELMMACMELGVSIDILNGDALALPARLASFNAVYGNIPYSITGELIPLLVKYYQGPVFLMLQREVAHRLSASPGSSSYGRLTVLVRLVYDVRLGPIVHPSAFRPPPKVYSQLVELTPRSRCDSSFIDCFEEFTACVFSKRRKKVVKVLKSCLGRDVPSEIAKRVEGLRVYEIDATTLALVARELYGCKGSCGTIYM
jgi:16S rRNA (adenine1518-N6/adenine1519-N6)-dimethyltransferase